MIESSALIWNHYPALKSYRIVDDIGVVGDDKIINLSLGDSDVLS